MSSDVLNRLQIASEWLELVSRHSGIPHGAREAAQGQSYSISKARAAVADLIAASEEFSELYGRLWDAVDPEDGGWLSSDSVKDYDAAHDRLSSALASCKESSHG